MNRRTLSVVSANTVGPGGAVCVTCGTGVGTLPARWGGSGASTYFVPSWTPPAGQAWSSAKPVTLDVHTVLDYDEEEG